MYRGRLVLLVATVCYVIVRDLLIHSADDLKHKNKKSTLVGWAMVGLPSATASVLHTVELTSSTADVCLYKTNRTKRA